MIFSKDPINTKRQLELDYARGLAVLFMIFIHAQIFYANDSVMESAFGVFNDFVGMVPAAPMFMFLLGVGVQYSRNSQPKVLFKRGFWLLAAGYFLNFLKSMFPALVVWAITQDPSYIREAIPELVSIDILQFSGLMMLCFGALKQFKVSNGGIVILAVVFGILNIAIQPLEIESIGLSAVVGLFVGCNEIAYFPFLTWVFYPLIGYLFGYYLQRIKDKKKGYLWVLVVGAVVYFLGSYLVHTWWGLASGMDSDLGYYHHNLLDNILFTALIAVELGLLYFISPWVPVVIQKGLIRWSKLVTPIFFIHWLLITWGTFLIPYNSLGMLPFIALLVFLVATSDVLASLYNELNSGTKKRRMNIQKK